MTKGTLTRRARSVAPPLRWLRSFRRACPLLVLAAVFTLLAAAVMPALAQTSAAPSSPDDDFGQYLVDHQDDLAPFFEKNSGDLFRLAVPVLLGMTGWILFFTMLLAWGIDVLMSRGYAFFYAPAFADLKRSIMYATGRLVLSFIYTCLMGLAIVLVIGLPHAEVIMLVAVLVLGVVAFAAQIVWILYLFRTGFGVSILFFMAVMVVDVIAASLIAQPVLGSRASTEVTNFVDRAITPRLLGGAEATRRELAEVTSGRNSAQAKVAESENAIAQAEAERDQLAKAIEEKKNSDIYTFAQIIKARARGELESARDQLAAFPAKFPASPLDNLARAQLAAINDQLAVQAAQQKQQEADAVRATAQARADLLARAAKGQVTLSEMRQAIIGKSRAQVGDLLGQPSETGPDQWSYRQQMIFNPLTSEKSGLTVYFNQGIVQSVDYNHAGGL